MYCLLMHISNTELPRFAQLLYKTIFVQSLCFTLENVARNQKITLNLIIPKYKRHTYFYFYTCIYKPIYPHHIHTPLMDRFLASLSYLSLIKGILQVHN